MDVDIDVARVHLGIMICEVHSKNTGQWQRSASGPCKIDFGKAIYWVEVTIERQMPSPKVVEFNAVALENIVF